MAAWTWLIEHLRVLRYRARVLKKHILDQGRTIGGGIKTYLEGLWRDFWSWISTLGGEINKSIQLALAGLPESLQEAIRSLKDWVVLKILEVVEWILSEFFEGVAEGTEESE